MDIRNFLHSQSSTYPSPSHRYFPISGQRTGDGEESVITNSKDASSYPDTGPMMTISLHRRQQPFRRIYFPTGPRITISLHHWQQPFPRRHFPMPGQKTGDGEISARIRCIRQYRYFPIPRHSSWDREVSAPFVESLRRRYFPIPRRRTGMGKYRHESVVSASTDTSPQVRG